MTKTETETETETTPKGSATGADAMAEGSNAEGATKGYLGQDAADQVQAAKDDGTTPDPRLLVTPTTFEGVQPPAGHVADPTSEGHVGSAGDAAADTSSSTDDSPAVTR